MKDLRVRTIGGADLYLTFRTKKKGEIARIVKDFIVQNVKVVESAELWRVFNLLRKEEEMLSNSVLTSTSFEYKNAMRTLRNEAEKRRKDYGIY